MTLERHTPLKRVPFQRKAPGKITPAQRKAWNDEPPVRAPKRTSRRNKTIPEASRAEVRRRSGGRCEILHEGCLGVGTSMHHRKLRRHGDHRPCNLIHVCAAMHALIHHYTWESYEEGWLVKAEDDPAAIPWTTLRQRQRDNQPRP